MKALLPMSNSPVVQSDANQSVIKVDWPAPENIKAYFTTRRSGKSLGKYRGFNLALHVDDEPDNVRVNRDILQSKTGLTQQPFWLEQVHENQVVEWKNSERVEEADASYTYQKNQPCIVMTADCLPILFTDKSGRWVASCHAGWRGLALGVIENTLHSFSGSSSDILAWIGPAISQQHFEVGREVKDTFEKLNNDNADFFKENQKQKYQFDFIGLAKKQLESLGVSVYGGGFMFFLRRGQVLFLQARWSNGRMASLIWRE